MIIALSITFVTPLGGLLALLVVAPLAAAAVSASRNARGRALLELPSPRGRNTTLLAVAAVPLLIGLAAAGPALRKHVGHRVRTNAQALFVFDTSRSMAASTSAAASNRFAQAQATAITLRNDVIPEVPSGVASFTTELIPHLFPTPNEAAFNSTVKEAIGIEKPPPPFFKFGISGTSFGALAGLRNQGYFDPATKHRYVILLTDGESGPFDPAALGTALVGPPQTNAFPGRPLPSSEPGVSLLVVRVGTAADRLYTSPHSIEAAYRPAKDAAASVESLASAAHGHAFAVADLSATSAALKRLVGSGKTSLQGVKTKTIALAPYVVLLAFVPLAFVIRRRNLSKI